jgi:hypothetical protein
MGRERQATRAANPHTRDIKSNVLKICGADHIPGGWSTVGNVALCIEGTDIEPVTIEYPGGLLVRNSEEHIVKEVRRSITLEIQKPQTSQMAA